MGVLWALGAAAQSAVPGKVLFIGNSYTYFWNLPQQVAALGQSGDHLISTRQSTVGGSNLGQHWRGERKLTSLELLQQGNFDAVVLQDHSMRSIDAPDSLRYFMEQFAQVAKEKGADVYLYLTWAREWDPYMQATITREYTQTARAIGATIVPVGPAWAKARSLRPELKLYDPDGSHPSPLGTYLTACVFYGILTGESPLNLPHRLISEDHEGEKLYLNIQAANDARFCQNVAADILNLSNE